MKPPKKLPPPDTNYGDYYAMSTEGGRIGLAVCLRCGATVIHGDDGAEYIHNKWHDDHD